MGDKFSVTITAKARHGKLWELRKQFGSNVALAAYLEVSITELGNWINLQKVPKRMPQEKKDRLEAKLAVHGMLLEDVFPPELTDDVLDRPKEFEVTREISLVLLGEAGGFRMIESPDDIAAKNEMREKLKQALYSLTPREEKVIKARFGLEGDEQTLEEVGNQFECTRTNIQRIESKALRKLRHPSRSKGLREYVTGQVRNSMEVCTLFQDQREICLTLWWDKYCKMHVVYVHMTQRLLNMFVSSGTYVRIELNDKMIFATRIESVYTLEYNTLPVSFWSNITPEVQVRPKDKIVIKLGPIINKSVKGRVRIFGDEIGIVIGNRVVREEV